MPTYDYIIIGSGIAGLYTALLAQERGSVLILTKSSIEECNTRYAQGGIAAPIGPGDSPELHIQDTLAAGAGLCDEEAVRLLAYEAADRIADLIHFGVPFDTIEGQVALTREAAHSAPRILHAGGDATGEHIETTLSRLAQASPRVEIADFHLATHLLVEKRRAAGVRVMDCPSGAITECEGQKIVVATGGMGQLYRFNTNPEVATGDGVALAYRAGAEVADMEFFQFHPTALRLPGAPPFLISEAMRGEGGILRNVRGEPFMKGYHHLGDLAPRDVVARSTLFEMEETGADHVLLDVTHLAPAFVSARFPSIYRFCLEHGVDITRQPIPVAPAAHYMMGGIKTNAWGETNLPGLFACGEAACTGVHGANRLASNSLLEVLIFAKRIVEGHESGREQPSTARPTSKGNLFDLPPARGVPGTPPPRREELQDLLWDKVGMVRSAESLGEARRRLAAWEAALPTPQDRPSWELANLVLLGRLVAEAAYLREESRGAHFRTDFPQGRPEWRRHIVFRNES